MDRWRLRVHAEMCFQLLPPFAHVLDDEALSAVPFARPGRTWDPLGELIEELVDLHAHGAEARDLPKDHAGRRMPPMASLFSLSLLAFLLSCAWRLPNLPAPPCQMASWIHLQRPAGGGRLPLQRLLLCRRHSCARWR